ncbi:MAG: ABC transporter permease [Thermonemataceae bacterium]
MQKHLDEQEWTEVISPKSSWFNLRLGELWRYRDLILLFVRRDFVAVYKQTILGPLWHVIQPLLTTLTFFIVFGQIANLSTDGTPKFLFYLCGTTVWNYFASCFGKTSGTFVNNAQIFGKVYFPRLTVPVSTVIASLFSFGINFIVFLIFYTYFYFTSDSISPNGWVLAVPLFLLIMAFQGLGFGIIISSLTTKYRDLTFLVTFGIQLFMYLSPVIYPMSSLSPKLQLYMSFNPIAPVLEGFRYAFLGSGVFNLQMLLYSILVTLVLFFGGVAIFHRVERNFMDTV